MATPVPYEGVQTQTPSLEPTPSVQVGANPAAFGGNIAEAAGHLGQIVEGSGKELFDRAYAMQELQVHADVNARLADAGNQMNDAYVKYSELEGKSAVDGLSSYQSSLDDIRKKSGDGLAPVGQEFYDAESRNQRNRLGFAGAGHAAQQQKQYVVGSAQAAMSNLQKQMELDPNNPGANAKALQDIKDHADFISTTHGIPLDSPGAIKARNDAVNTAVQGQVRSLAKDDPISAQRLFDQSVKSGSIDPADAANLGWYIRNQRDVIGSRTTAAQVMSDASRGSGPVLRALFGNEDASGDLKAENPQTTTSGHAQGAFQITTGTWREFASQAGVDLAAFPDAKSAPYAVQAQMANVIPLRRWDKTTIAKMQAAGGQLDVNKTLGQNLAANGEGLGRDVGMPPTLSDLTSAGRAEAERQFPGDKTYADIVEDKIITQFNKEKAIRADTDFNNEQTVQGALLSGVGPNKKIPTTVEELKLDPTASSAWDALESQHPTELKRFLNQMATNAKGDVAMTPERLNDWQKLSGQAVQDPEGFMKATQDLSAVDLPRAQKLEIIRMQDSIYKKQDAAPQVSHALGVIGRLGMLDAAGITKEQDPDSLHLFTGVLQDAMTQYQQTNGKPMSDEDIKTTSQQLLSTVPGKHWWSGSSNWFRSIDEVPDEAKDAISKEFTARGIVPSEAAIMQTYLAQQYQEVYGKPAKSQVPRQ